MTAPDPTEATLDRLLVAAAAVVTTAGRSPVALAELEHALDVVGRRRRVDALVRYAGDLMELASETGDEGPSPHGSSDDRGR